MIKATKGKRGATKEINGKSWDFEPIFFQIFSRCFDSSYGPFYGWRYTFSLVLKYFVNAPPIHHRCIWRKKLFCQERKKMQALQSFLCFSPIHDTFSVVHVFCVKFVGKMMCLRKCWCFLQGWYLCQIERRAVVYIFRKDVYQGFNFWTVFLHR